MNERIEKIKNHFSEKKDLYLVGLGSAAVGAVVAIVILGKSESSSSEIVQKITQIGFGNRATAAIINLTERSTASKPVHLVGTNLYFNSLSEAARETGHPLSTISKQINGHIPNVKGDVFKILEQA